MAKLKHVETLLFQEDLEKLKKKSGEDSTKEALYKAAQHMIQCEYC